MRRALLTGIALGGGLLALAGCTSRDPYYRTDVWRPTGANSANIAAMVANPQDLIRGHASSSPPLSQPQVAAVEKAWAGTSGGGGTSGGSGDSAGGASGGGASGAGGSSGGSGTSTPGG